MFKQLHIQITKKPSQQVVLQPIHTCVKLPTNTQLYMNAPITLIKVSVHTCKVWKWNYTRAIVSMKGQIWASHLTLQISPKAEACKCPSHFYSREMEAIRRGGQEAKETGCRAATEGPVRLLFSFSPTDISLNRDLQLWSNPAVKKKTKNKKLWI